VTRWLIAALVAAAAAVAVIVLAGGEDATTPAERPRAATPRADPPRDQVAAHLAALQRIADEHGDTRAAGTPGDRATSDYLVEQLRPLGYRVTTQDFRVPFYRERRPPRLVAGGRRIEDIRAFQFSPSGRVSGRVREIPALGCDASDYAALEAGEIALIRRGDCFFVVKASLAREAGASAALIANDGRGPTPGSLFEPGDGIPVVGVTSDARLAGRRATVTVDAVSENRETTNVIAETGPEDARRVVMAGAHHDSVPAGPGMNDNGSGTVALLTIAERIPADRLPPDTALRLGFWGAEEIGLLGSRRYVRRLTPAARERIVAYLNLDMVGSPDAEPAVYDTDDRIEEVIRRHLPAGAPEEQLEGNSDHAPFEDANIPVGGIFTGLDDCYHQACDTLRNVDRAVLGRSIRAAQATLLDLAR
jgi:peptidase M28-like protein/PA domain-containing protein